MRGLVILLAFAGCGRIGFDAQTAGDSGSDAPGNAVCGTRDRPSLAMGARATCMVRLDGSLWCAGVGYGPRFTRVDSSNRYLRVDGEEASFCALDVDCALSCWGDNLNGELGLGDTMQRVLPTPVTPGVRYRDIGAGGFHTCAVREDGALLCWGRNIEGELGFGDNSDRHAPERVGTSTWNRVVRGYLFTCAFDASDRLWCWGANDSGQLGNNDPGTDQPSPILVSPVSRPWIAASAGKQHVCALDADHALWCWGLNMMGQVGTGDVATPIAVPTRSGTVTSWDQIVAGRFTSCATQTDHSLWCWGDNAMGATGIPGMIQWSSPQKHVQPATWSVISPMNVASCGFDAAGDLYCWGENSSGQLGLGDTAMKGVPTKVTFP